MRYTLYTIKSGSKTKRLETADIDKMMPLATALWKQGLKDNPKRWETIEAYDDKGKRVLVFDLDDEYG